LDGSIWGLAAKRFKAQRHQATEQLDFKTLNIRSCARFARNDNVGTYTIDSEIAVSNFLPNDCANFGILAIVGIFFLANWMDCG
jgi:hypothetical protein